MPTPACYGKEHVRYARLDAFRFQLCRYCGVPCATVRNGEHHAQFGVFHLRGVGPLKQRTLFLVLCRRLRNVHARRARRGCAVVYHAHVGADVLA